MTLDIEEKLRLLQTGPEGPRTRLRKRKPTTKKSVTTPPSTTTPLEVSLETWQGHPEEEATEEDNVIFRPNPGPQEDFLAANEPEVMFGGSAGGGKSYAMLIDPLRYVENPKFSGLLLRRTNDELRDLVMESKNLYVKAFPGAKWSEKASTWNFPSGAKMWFSYLDRDDDVLRYQGQAFNWVGFDELTQWPTAFPYNYMRSRLRSPDPTLPKHLRASTNPGGPGHMWVKKMFIDPAPPGEAFWATDIESGEVLRYPDNHRDPDKAGKPLFKRRFIPSRLQDNPYLYNDGEYELRLLSLPEKERRQLLYGDWNVAEGAAFTEWDPQLHVTEAFDIPKHWPKFRACDYGYSSHTGVLWFTVDPKSDTLFVYRELYVKGVIATDLADMIIDIESGDGRINYGVLDSSLWHKRGDTGPSLAEKMIQRGCFWRPSDRSKGSRVAGKNEIHRRLQVDPYTGEPRLVIFDNCRNLIAQLPTIPLDKRNPEDVDTNFEHDHLYDALRYGIMSRPSGHIFSDEDFYEPEPFDRQFGY